MYEYLSLISRFEWTVLFIAFVVSSHSPNIRWLTGTIITFKTIDILTIDIILKWGGGYYVAISILDLLIITSILFRQKTAGYIASLKIPWLSRLALGSTQYYKLTSNEIGLITLYLVSIAINLASLAERLIRKHSEFDPMFIYNNYPMVKLALTALIVLILCSLAINGANNIYRDRKSNKL
jgi:hypothetical protein